MIFRACIIAMVNLICSSSILGSYTRSCIINCERGNKVQVFRKKVIAIGCGQALQPSATHTPSEHTKKKEEASGRGTVISQAGAIQKRQVSHSSIVLDLI